MSKLFIIPSAVTVLILGGCAQAVALDPAPGANDPACAEVIIRLPDTVADLARRTTNAQSTGAWGDPAGVVLRCGVETPGPSLLPCITIDGVDWLRDDSNDPMFIFTTYGRTPATEVAIDATLASGESTLSDLSASVAEVPASKTCEGETL